MQVASHNFLVESTEDYVGLWSLVKQVRREHPTWDDKTIRHETLGLLRSLMEDELIVAGGPTKTSVFVPWPRGISGTIEIITHEWETLGRDPDIGEIVWFTATPKGEAFVNSSYRQ